MIELSAAEIAAITNGKLAGAIADARTLTTTSAATDSREIRPGALFIAKPGELSDGHLFVEPAFAAGAVLALVEHEVTDGDGAPFPSVVVADAVLAMGLLAAELIRRVRAAGELTVVGITGSAGKTTTKDLLAGLLGAAAPTVAPVGSYNGEVGVPLTVFGIDYDTRYLIVEMGATKIGHINYLADMVRPDIGVVLGVGTAHAGEFGGVENIAAAKGELVEGLAAGGTAVLNADDDRVAAMAARTAAHLLMFSANTENRTLPDSAAAVVARDINLNEGGHPEFTLVFPDGTEAFVASKLIGRHHVANLLAAASTAFALGLAPEQIAGSLSAQGAASRWRMERTDRPDGITVINDAYNANPDSMRAALRALAELGRERRTWAVLGEMLELGPDSIIEHDAVGRYLVRLNIKRLLVVGPGARAMHSGAVMEGSWGDESAYVESVDEAEQLLRRELRPGDLVLVKSSNGAGLRILGDRLAFGVPEGTDGAGTDTAHTTGTGA